MATYCAVMSITPGPNNMLLTASGANFGFARTLPQMAGIIVGGFVMTAGCCLGIGALFTRFPASHAWLQGAGALYLAWLAWRLSGAAVGAASSPRPMSFTEGTLFQFMNPKGWIKALTLASVFMPAEASPVVAALGISVVGAVVGVPCISVWALFGVAIRGWLREPRRQRAFNVAMAAILLVLALLFLR
jgi:threonine/homoserine/homoserine lactone efflux protein